MNASSSEVHAPGSIAVTMVVHLFDARQAASIRRGGVRGRPSRIAVAGDRVELSSAVYVMPVLPNFFASHQWLRELKRRGMRTIDAAYIRLRSDTMVWCGNYNGEHRWITLGHATGLIMNEPDPRGWEIVLTRDVPAKAIHSIRNVPQVVGWRYFPESHVKGPWKCLCDGCLRGLRGEIKSQRLRASLLAQHGAESLNYEGDPKRLARARRNK